MKWQVLVPLGLISGLLAAGCDSNCESARKTAGDIQALSANLGYARAHPLWYLTFCSIYGRQMPDLNEAARQSHWQADCAASRSDALAGCVGAPAPGYGYENDLYPIGDGISLVAAKVENICDLYAQDSSDPRIDRQASQVIDLIENTIRPHGQHILPLLCPGR